MKNIKLKVFTAILFSLLFIQAKAQSEVIHLFISDIPGSSGNNDFQGWIPVESYGFELSRALYLEGSNGLSSSGSVHSGKIIILIPMTDKSVPELFNSVCSGTVRPEIKIIFAAYHGAGNNTHSYLEEITLKDVIIDGIDFYADEDLEGNVQISMAYTKIERKLEDISNLGTATNPTEFKWDLQTGRTY